VAEHRDIDLVLNAGTGGADGRKVIAVIGINRYESWAPLSNAVNDAMEARRVFQSLGFEELTAPLRDADATGEALHALVADDLRRNLGPDDSLVLFYAGHGSNIEHRLDQRRLKSGYLIPADAKNAPDEVATWIELDSWLRNVSLLPAKHVLVILDACYSGIALGTGIEKYRGDEPRDREALLSLSQRRSRRIITSALPDERALDSGPRPGNSLFTGYLIEGLEGGLARDGRREATGSRLGEYVRWRVCEHTSSKQTPDFGAFALDERGEMVIPLVGQPSQQSAAPPARAPTARTQDARESRAVISASNLSWSIAILLTLLVGGIGALMALGWKGGRSQAQPPSDTNAEASAGTSIDGGMLTLASVGANADSQPAAPEPRRVTVLVTSDPAGATASVGGTAQSGKTPITFRRLIASRPYRIKIERPGFLASEITIRPEDGDPPVVKLKRKPIVLRVNSDPPGAAVWLSHWRQKTLTTPVDIRLPASLQGAKRVRISLEKEGYLLEAREIVLDPVEHPETMVQEVAVGLRPDLPSSTAARAER
jgi:uncharacterized caspase-like protein